MRRITAMQAPWQADTQEGEFLSFRRCKGGCFSTERTLSGRSKNLQPLLPGTVTVCGVTVTALSDGSIRMQGTTTGAGGRMGFGEILPPVPLCAGVTYSISGGVSGMALYASDCQSGAVLSGSTFTPTEDVLATLGFNFARVNMAVDITTRVQLEVGATPTAFEPAGILVRPLALALCGRTVQDGEGSATAPAAIRCVKAGTRVLCRGKNLCPPFGGFERQADGSYANTRTINTKDLIELDLPAGTYTVSYSAQSPVGCNYRIRAHHPDGTYTEHYQASTGKLLAFSFSTDKPITGLRWHYSASCAAGSLVYRDLQLERGSVATAMEPYAPVGEAIAPCDLYEGDLWYPTLGVVEKHNEVIFSYNGEPLHEGYVATTGVPVTGATVIDPLPTPVTVACTPVPLCAPPGCAEVDIRPVEERGTLSATLPVHRAD